ncbi:hypothetical protein ACSBR2_016710 [Camellia fascicularis]
MENLLLAVPIWVSSCPTATIFRRACELAFVECHTGAICGWWTPLLFSLLGDSIKPAIPNMDEFEIHELFKSFDTDSDGRINKDAFIACLRRNSLLVALFSPQLMHKNLSRDEEILDEVYASNGSKPAPDYSRPKRSKRSKQKRANRMHSLCPDVWSEHRRWLLMSIICLNPLACCQ